MTAAGFGAAGPMVDFPESGAPDSLPFPVAPIRSIPYHAVRQAGAAGRKDRSC